jgi:XRE family transcriptional regulator, regulator of sulfur utilization
MPRADLGGSIRRLRESQGMSLRSLATTTGLSASFLSQVENGQASPSIASMERIAAGLGVRLAEFFNQVDAPPTVVKADARLLLTSEWSKARIERLSAGSGPGGVDAVLVTIEPGGMSGKHAYAAPGEEFALVLVGPTTLTLEESEQVLQSGDAVTIPTGVGRRWHNPHDAPVVILMVSSR